MDVRHKELDSAYKVKRVLFLVAYHTHPNIIEHA